MNMIEKISRALCQKCATEDPGWWDVDLHWPMFKQEAIIAMEAMKDPTKSIKIAFESSIIACFGYDENHYDSYLAMINAALKDE